MASEDPSDRPLSRYSFVEWLQGIIQSFRGGASRQYLISDSGPAPGKGDAPPILAMAARQRFKDTLNKSVYFSRMEEAKAKAAMWNNDLYPLVLSRLKKMFHEENFLRMRLTPHTSSNLMRRIVEDISILYEGPARRQLEQDDEQVQTDASGQEGTKADGTADPVPDKTDGKPGVAPPADDGTGDPTGAASSTATKVDSGNPEVDALASLLDLEGDEETTGEKDTPLEEVMALCDLDLTLDLVEKMCRIHEAVWVMPKVVYDKVDFVERTDAETGLTSNVEEADPASGKLTYLIFDPSCADVVEDPENPQNALAWYHCAWELNMRGETIMVWHFYTRDEYWKFDAEWHTMSHDVNELGRLPVSVFRKELPTPGGYYVEGCGRDIFEATLELCVLRTMQNSRYRDSGFKQLAFSNADEESVPADQVIGSPTPIYLGDGGTATVLDLQPMLAEMGQICKDRADEVADKYGAKYQSGFKTLPQSGFAKKLEREKVLRENLRIRKFFKSAEQDLYNLLAVTLEKYPIAEVPSLPSDGKLEIDFCEPTFEEDPKDQAIVDAQNLKLNKTSIIDVLKRENPDLNEVELLEMAEKNRAINAIFLQGDQLKLIDLLAQNGMTAASDPSKDPAGPKPAGGANGPPGK